MAENILYTEVGKHAATAKGFRVLNKHVCFPRYAYHKWLVDWSLKDADLIKGFQKNPLKESIVLVGGDLSKENRSLLCSKDAEGNCFSDLTPETIVGDHLLFVYFVTLDDLKKPEGFQLELKATLKESQCKKANVLQVFSTDCKPHFIRHDPTMFKRANQCSTVCIELCEGVDIRHRITEILENRLNLFLCPVIEFLSHFSPAKDVEERLEQIRAVQESLLNTVNSPIQQISERPYDENKVKQIIEQYEKKILYYGFNKEGVRILTTEESVKEDLKNLLSNVGMLKVEIHVSEENQLEVIPFSFPLHGAKQLIRGERTTAYSTIGSLVKRDGEKMAALTCRHALVNRENPNVSIEINEAIRIPASNMFYAQETRTIQDDLALFDIDEQMIPFIESNCEKRLLGVSGEPAPAYIPNSINFSLVHKRGASTNFTTGLIFETGYLRHNVEFTEKALVLLVKPFGDDRLFATHGDSGALVFKPALYIDMQLEVIGMVIGRVPVTGFFKDSTVVCIPLIEAVDKLKQRFQGINNIEFY